MFGIVGAIAFVLALVLGFFAAMLFGLIDPDDVDTGGGI